ncbi:MAG: hypothetical protein B7Y53_00925, partial [Halothiobacillus sp. 28-55-5]
AAHNAAQLRLLTQWGLVPGQTIVRTQALPGASDVGLQVEKQTRAINESLAQAVWVMRNPALSPPE